MPKNFRTLLSLLFAAGLLLTSGCATKTQKKVTNAATAPLSDLNLMSEDIPLILQKARHHRTSRL